MNLQRPGWAFLSVASAWCAPDRWGEVHTKRGAQGQAKALKSPLALKQAQESALMQVAEADTMVDLMLQRGQPELMCLLPPGAACFADVGLDAGRPIETCGMG